MNVLLVEDEQMMRKMVKLALQKRGFEVFDASNSAEAIAVAEERSIDVLVTDIVLTGVDGWTLARQIVERQSNLPIVFTSGYPVDFEVERQNHACCSFLPKPFQPQDLMQAIREVTSVPASAGQGETAR